MDYSKDIVEYINIEKQILDSLDVSAVNEMMQVILEAYENEKRIYIFGNGGSSATASHYQNDFNKGLSLLKRAIYLFCVIRISSPDTISASKSLRVNASKMPLPDAPAV